MAVPADPKQLMLPDPHYQPSYLSDKIVPLSTTFGGFGMVAIGRMLNKRPPFSGIQHHFLYAALGYAFGQFLQNRFENYTADREAVFRHYIELHPEDFPTPVRTKIGDIFPKYTPIR